MCLCHVDEANILHDYRYIVSLKEPLYASDMTDPNLIRAKAQIETVDGAMHPIVKSFFDEPSNTASYVVHDPATLRAGIIDSVLDFDAAAGRTSTASADAIIAYVRGEGLTIDWLLETHAHADHLSAAPYLQRELGGTLAIGRDIIRVQEVFGKIFNVGTEFARDGADFDRLFDDGDVFAIGDIPALALHVPGHTPADMAYVIGDAVFTGDTLFMPDYGSARADFPGGDARQLYRSIRRLLSLPDRARLFLCHDYKAAGRDQYAWETTVGAQRTGNIHVHEGVGEDEFVAMRTARDATLAMPRIIMPAVQVNMRAGHLPEPEANGTRYLKIPLDVI
jgi:glyoxylase-like metal-dependent hydrolase (beta-lactamase superfamily II)